MHHRCCIPCVCRVLARAVHLSTVGRWESRIVGVACIEPSALEQRTSAYEAWARRIPDVYEIPVLAAPSGVRKEEVVEPYYRRLMRARAWPVC